MREVGDTQTTLLPETAVVVEEPPGGAQQPQALEDGWEDSLLVFPARAIDLGRATVQQEFIGKLRKTFLATKDKEQAKKVVDSTPSSSTLHDMIAKGICYVALRSSLGMNLGGTGQDSTTRYKY